MRLHGAGGRGHVGRCSDSMVAAIAPCHLRSSGSLSGWAGDAGYRSGRSTGHSLHRLVRTHAQLTQIMERPRHVRTRFGNLVLKGESDLTFEPEAGGTRLTQESTHARLFATGSYRGASAVGSTQFREIVERQARSHDDDSASG